MDPIADRIAYLEELGLIEKLLPCSPGPEFDECHRFPAPGGEDAGHRSRHKACSGARADSKDADFEAGMQDGFFLSGRCQNFAPGVNDHRMSAQLEAAAWSAAVIGKDENLIFDRPGPAKCLPVHQPFNWPGCRQKEYGNIFKRQQPDQFAKAQIIADDGGAFDAVEHERGDSVSGCEIQVFATGRK